MIQLKFTVTDESLKTVEPPEQTPWGAIVETVFEMPIYFIIDGTNILGWHGGGTEHLSVVGFAAGLKESFERLKPGGTEHMPIGSAGSLFMQQINGKVKFWTTTFRPDVAVPYEEVAVACRAFHREVQRVMEARLPSIRKHPQWSRWFPSTDSTRHPNPPNPTRR